MLSENIVITAILSPEEAASQAQNALCKLYNILRIYGLPVELNLMPMQRNKYAVQAYCRYRSLQAQVQWNQLREDKAA